jgi:hypothetical protein
MDFGVTVLDGMIDLLTLSWSLASSHASQRYVTLASGSVLMSQTSHDRSRSVYGKITELVPLDAPEPLGKHMTLTHYVDTNLMHDVVTGRSVTDILHLANKTTIDWYTKKQASVETATY